jgi:hypothetical protein
MSFASPLECHCPAAHAFASLKDVVRPQDASSQVKHVGLHQQVARLDFQAKLNAFNCTRHAHNGFG